MSSSTSSSKLNIAVFLVVFLALMLPHEWWVRRSEAVYGSEPVLFRPPLADNAKFDAFIADVAGGRRFDMYCVGSSMCEYGMHPDLLAAALPAGRSGVFNLAFSGTSALCGLEILRRLKIVPTVLVVAVNPFDFTRTSVERGEKILAHGEESKGLRADDHPPVFDVRAVLERWTRDVVWSAVHSAQSGHHRVLPQWIAFFRLAGLRQDALLRFLNNPEWTLDEETWANLRYYVEFSKHGYLGLKLRWLLDEAAFERECTKPNVDLLETQIAVEYARDHPRYLEQMRAALKLFREAGSRIVLVRIPQFRKLDDRQDALIPFDADMRKLAADVGAAYVSVEVVPPGFRENRDNFRDAEHLHFDSSIVYSRLLAEVIRVQSTKY